MTGDPQARLTHLDEDGAVRMVDVGEKEITSRKARAQARVRMSPATASAVGEGQAPKGDVLTTARLAGIQAAKQTGLLIPLAHPLQLSFIDVQASIDVHEGIVELIADDRRAIEERLCHWSDVERCELVLTTGGTGFAPTDVTPEATRAVIEREAPGIAEAMRAASRPHTRHWMLSRGVAGIRGSSLIVNFPGSPASIVQAGEAIAEALPHAIALIVGEQPAHRKP